MHRINQGIRFIEKNLMNPFSLKDVAYESCTSFYHFHRLFKTVTGMGLKQYIRNRRLSEAAIDLLNGEPIINTALKYQFASQQDFTRAFQRKFCISPGCYRKYQKKLSLLSPITFDQKMIKMYNNVLNMKPKFISLPEQKFVGLIMIGKNDHKENIKLHYNLLERKDEIKYKQSKYCRNFGKDLIINGKRNFFFAVAFPVHFFSAIPDGMECFIFGPGLYVQFTYGGTIEYLLGIVYTYIFDVWQKESEYEIIGDELRTSVYRNNICTPENEEIKIIIPVRKKMR